MVVIIMDNDDIWFCERVPPSRNDDDDDDDGFPCWEWM
jgi:hypothetical protein